MTALAVTALVLSAAPLAASDPAADAALSPLLAAAPKCPAGVKACVGLVVHAVVTGEKPVQSAEWLAVQLSEANRHFAPAGIGFELQRLERLPPDMAFVRTREDRDRAGRDRYSRRVIHVLLVERLLDVDQPGEIRGVHWRDRARRSHRWVFLASIAPEWVLAHELGHFFGLPHSRHPESIMNKTPRTTPDPATWSFAAAEYRRIEYRLRHMLRSKELVPLARPRPIHEEP